MRTVKTEIKVYKFEELSDKAKDNAMIALAPDHNWWEFLEEDIRQIALELKEFDIGRGSKCVLAVKEDLHATANLIREHHGKECDTYIAAEQYINNDFTGKEFLHELQECYRIMLEEGYDYLCSEEYIKELCDCNEYEFLENGELYYK